MSDIAELFSTDPLKLTSKDFVESRQAANDGLRPIESLIARYRAARAQWDVGVRAAGSTKNVKEAVPKIKELDLKDLDL